MGDESECFEAFLRLKSAGWLLVVTALDADVWIVSGTNGENRIHADAPTQAAAWREALEQARAVGMLGLIQPGEPGMG